MAGRAKAVAGLPVKKGRSHEVRFVAPGTFRRTVA